VFFYFNRESQFCVCFVLLSALFQPKNTLLFFGGVKLELLSGWQHKQAIDQTLASSIKQSTQQRGKGRTNKRERESNPNCEPQEQKPKQGHTQGAKEQNMSTL
jgi:hypothetical protein